MAETQRIESSKGSGDPKAPSYLCAAYREQLDRWELCHDLRGGPDVVRSRGQKYLPLGALELPKEYETRLLQAPFFNGFERSIKGLTGMVFRKPLVITKESPQSFKDDALNIDGQGTEISVWAAEVFEEGEAQGHTFAIVDFPSLPRVRRIDRDQARRQNLRPYWIHIRADQVINWRTRIEGGVTILALLVVREHVTVPDGPFGEKRVCRYRVFRNIGGVITWEIWTESVRGGTTAYTILKGDAGVIEGPDTIPIRCFYSGEKIGYFKTKPQLLGLAYSNISHYQVAADRRNALHLTGNPMLIRIGCEPDTPFLPVGSNVGLNVPMGGDAKWIEPPGSGLGALKDELNDLKAEMAAQGLAMLMRETRQAETAEAKRIDKSEQDSPLARSAKRFKDFLNELAMLHQQFKGETDTVVIDLDVNFEELSLDAATIDSYGRMVDAKRLSLTTMWEILKKGGSLPEDFDAEKELERIADESLTVIGGTPTDPEPIDPETPQDEPSNKKAA